MEGHTDTVTCCCYTPDDKKVVSCSADKSIKVYTIILIVFQILQIALLKRAPVIKVSLYQCILSIEIICWLYIQILSGYLYVKFILIMLDASNKFKNYVYFITMLQQTINILFAYRIIFLIIWFKLIALSSMRCIQTLNCWYFINNVIYIFQIHIT